ncbi:peptide ABC transporter substrate-binding protein [Aerococcaceae bacterium INB8]|uniref:Peptide ABC transporter substrate-binding protein n=1 Tax=Ruoffia halotolerans TaxID=2748684 RepID=A0A839A3M7_9LACT|nr:peptide ABC transporter substrate-binding protein [Ruoffia halotolerans]MBA5728323.1 peptide ABC transporter substrate-binding protein [Ruoffia halotolerans]
MKRIKQLFLLLLVSLMFAPGAHGVFAQAPEPGVLRTSLASDPVLDPALVPDTYSGIMIKNLMEGLTRPDAEGAPEPAMAESWDVSEDGLVYTFHLREASWSNGDPVTAGDFEFAWKRVLDPDIASPKAGDLFEVANAQAYYLGEAELEDVGVKALDDKTLEVTLENPTPYFLDLTARTTVMYPVNPRTVEENSSWALEGGENYVTNGPFTLSEWEHNSYFVFSKSPSYWDNENVQLETVEIQIIEAESTANAAFQAGEIDFVGIPFNAVSIDALDTYRADGTLETVDFAALYEYKMNVTDSQLSNVNIRKALAYGIDRQTLIDNITKANETPALGLVSPAMRGFEDSNNYFQDGDFEVAREYLAKGLEELGLNDPSELTVTLTTNTSETHGAIAQYLQAGWVSNLGINVEIANQEWQVHLDNLLTLNYQLGRLGSVAEYNDPNAFLEMYYELDNGMNRTGWENAEYQALLDEANVETDEAARVELLKQAEVVFMDEMPTVPVYFYSNAYVAKDFVQNMHPDAFVDVQLKHVVVE